MTLTFEQRKRQVELIGTRVRGMTPAQLRIERDGSCVDCGGPLPCSECSTAAEAQRSEPVKQRTKRRAPRVDHTRAARQEYDLLVAREGHTPRTVRKADALAEARRDYARMLADERRQHREER
jgi:hypothetical protein